MASQIYMKRGGIPVDREADQGQRLEPIPAPLEGVADNKLRWNGTAVEDASDNTEFYITAGGEKCLINDDPNAVINTISVTFDRRGGSNPHRINRASGSFMRALQRSNRPVA